MDSRLETEFGVFEWDEHKERVNLRKHRILFSEAVQAIGDRFALLRYDAAHSVAEDRYEIIGASKDGRMLAVVATMRNGTWRIITARAATRKEKWEYAEKND